MGSGVKKLGTDIGRFTPIGALGGMYNDANKNAANAAQGAALAQQRAAQQNYERTASIVNPATVQGLASLDRDIKNQEKNLARQEQLISQIDPTILEASQQALRLLRGQESSSLAPVKAQRDMQRQKLLNQLREQLGPGAETSTAGIQALTRFDSETNNLMAGQQQSALQGLGQTANQFNAVRPDMFREIMGLSGLGQEKTKLQYNQAAALSGAWQGMQQTAGAQYTGQMMQAQQQQALNNQLIGGAVKLGSAYATGGLSLGADAVGGATGGANGGGTIGMMRPTP